MGINLSYKLESSCYTSEKSYSFYLSDIYSTCSQYFARNRINRVGLLPSWYTILRFRENMPQCLKRFLGNFNIVASQNSFYGFRNAMKEWDNRKTSSCNLVHQSVK